MSISLYEYLYAVYAVCVSVVWARTINGAQLYAGRQGMSFDDEFLLSPNGKEAISKSPEKFKLLKVSILQSLK